MLFFSEQNTQQIHQLLEEGKEYLLLQKRYLGLQSAEMLTKLLTGIAVWAIIILVGALVLLFGSFALAFLLAKFTGSVVIGFGIMALVLALIIFIVYVNREAWIMAAVAKFVVNITAPPAQDETYALSPALTAAESEKVRTELTQRRMQMKQSAQTLLEPSKATSNRWELASGLLRNSATIFKGIQLGASAIAAVRLLLGGKKRRWRR